MSIINLFLVKQTLIGKIKTKETKNYAFFSLNDTQVKHELSSTFHAINENIKAKSYRGELKFCRFVDHDGKSCLYLITRFILFNLSCNLSVPSIAEHVGQDGSFIVGTFHFKKNKKTILLIARGSTDNILKFHTNSFPFTGECETATAARNAARIVQKKTYCQHLTAGVLLRCNLPRAVLKDEENPILRQLAEEFVDISFLTNKTITVSLIHGDLKLWEVEFETCDNKSSIRLNLGHLGCEIEMVQSSSDELELKLFEMVELVWNFCDTIFKFVLVINHILLSERSVIEEKFFLNKTVNDVTKFA